MFIYSEKGIVLHMFRSLLRIICAMSKIYILIVFLLLLCSCKKYTNKYQKLVDEWHGKEIIFPDYMPFTIYANDTVNYSVDGDLKILLYIDAVGCTSCKMRISEWKLFISQIDSISNNSIPFIFIMRPKDTNNNDYIRSFLKKNFFNKPVYIDNDNIMNNKNHFPTEIQLQTFLLDRENKVILMGNPIYNPEIKQLYLKVIKEQQQK